MTTKTVILPKLHSAQWQIVSDKTRFKVASCGRRFGKTLFAGGEAVVRAAKGGRVWWVAPTYDVTRRGWAGVTTIVKQIPGVEIKRGNREVIFPSGGFIAFKTADTGAGLLGEGLDLCVIDEAALVRETAWTQDLRPALSDRKGGALFIGTPRGRNWFWRAWMYGQDPAREDWASWQFPTSANPYIDPTEIQAAKDLVPERTFEQEYLALFLDDGGAVFRNIKACATVKPGVNPQTHHDYVFGVDWGKSEDFTAIAIIDKYTRELVHIERFNQIGWTLQRGRLSALNAKWKPTRIIAETNAMGDPNVEALHREGLPIRGFQTTAQSKTPLIESLALAFEREDLHIVDDPVLVGELQAYTMERLPSGRFRYSAPSGMHDDTVIATALAFHGLSRGRGAGSPVRQ